MTHRVYVPMPTCTRVPALADNPFRAQDDLYATLSDAGMDLRWTEYVRAIAPTPDDITALRVPLGGGVLVTRRVTTDVMCGLIHTGRCSFRAGYHWLRQCPRTVHLTL